MLEHPGTVLIVDDDPMVLRSLSHQLARSRYTLALCLTPSEAIRHVTEGNVQVIVSDIMMPEMSGIELLRIVRQHDSDLPVVLMTGQPELATAAEGVELGAFRYLIKPVNPQDILNAVERAARLYRLAKTKRQAIELLGDGSGEGERTGLETNFQRALNAI